MIPGKMFFASPWLMYPPKNQCWGKKDRATDQFLSPEMEVGPRTWARRRKGHFLEAMWCPVSKMRE